MERFEIPDSTAARLKTFSQEHNATFFMTMTAAFMKLLQNRSDQEDIVIGGISSGRKREETMGLLGCFLNTVPIRCAFSKDLPFTDVLGRVNVTPLSARSLTTKFPSSFSSKSSRRNVSAHHCCKR